MPNYDFSTLNSSDLEELVCDLLNNNQPFGSLIKYKTFKEGKDKGIDILYSTNDNLYEHVGQVKHYYRTGYDQMFNELKNKEVNKVFSLNPNKYIFATSVDLSVNNSEKIKEIFEPYIRNLNDIYGKKDLNRLISNNDNILRNHYKLCFSDFSILNSILTSNLDFRSSHFEENELKRRIRLYVKTPILDESRKALEKNKFVVLTGEPGVGKTTLAEMLVYDFIRQGYRLSYILDDIKEAESVLTPDDTKQIIYFDDFLGSNAVEINKAKGSETALRKILRRVSQMQNKLIILTTRTFLLATIESESEQLRRFNLKAKTSLFELNEYSSEIRRQLLVNHIENSDLSEDYITILNEDAIQDFIIYHRFFSPRSVEFITNKEIISDIPIDDFKTFIIENFNSPSDIWLHAYSQQIKEEDRFLLNTLLSFGDSASIFELEIAFLARIDYEVKTNNKSKEMHAFIKAMERLDDGFIVIKNKEVRFINPSLTDFLLKHLRADLNEVSRIMESITFVSQLTERLFTYSKLEKAIMPDSLKIKLLSNYRHFVNPNTYDYDLIRIAITISNYIESEEKEDVLCKIINEIKNWEDLSYDYNLNFHFQEFMKSLKLNSKVYLVLEKNLSDIISELFSGENNIEEGIELLEKLSTNFNYKFHSNDNSRIINHFEDIFNEYISQEVDDLIEDITDESEAKYKIDEINFWVSKINNLGLNFQPNMDLFAEDWEEIARDNEFRRVMAKDN